MSNVSLFPKIINNKSSIDDFLLAINNEDSTDGLKTIMDKLNRNIEKEFVDPSNEDMNRISNAMMKKCLTGEQIKNIKDNSDKSMKELENFANDIFDTLIFTNYIPDEKANNKEKAISVITKIILSAILNSGIQN